MMCQYNKDIIWC